MSTKHHQRQQTTITPLTVDTCKKLNRASNVTTFIGIHLRTMNADNQPLLWLPDIFSYVSDDLKEIKQELSHRGLLPHDGGSVTKG